MISLDVSTAMATPVQTTTAALPVAEATQEMRSSGIGALVVLDGAGDIAGIVTQSDVIGLIADGDEVTGATVGDVMSTPVVTVASDEHLVDAAELMKDHSVRRLPVVDGGELVGIVTTTDLTHYLPRLRNTILRERAAGTNGGKRVAQVD